MNSRRVHDLMRAHFASVGSASVDWQNLVDEHGLLMNDRVKSVLLKHFIEQGTAEVLVEVQRKVGDLLSLNDIVPYLQGQIGRSSIRIANRDFTIFGELAINGVGRSWRKHQ